MTGHLSVMATMERDPTPHKKPSEIYFRSTKKIWWKCANGPDHEWKAEVRSRFKIGKNKNIEITKCPYCAGNRKKVNRVLDALNDFGQMRDEFEMDYDSLSFGSVDLDVFVG